jgi:hypothetical protein
MSRKSVPSSRPRDAAGLQAAFLALLPRIEGHADVAFRDVRCPDHKEELRAEAVALAWLWFLRLADRGRDAAAFPGALATFACRAARSGRRLCGQEAAGDVLSRRAQRCKGFAVSPLPATSTLGGNAYDEALRDNTRTPPDEQAAFRIDFPAWLASQGRRRRRVAEELMGGESPRAVARRLGVSPPRISQMRRELHDDWHRFCGTTAETAQG